MCGIAGEVGFPAAFSLAEEARLEVRRMVAAMHNRGPDETGFYADDASALGMSRLAIIDVVGGSQPIATADDRYVIVYNGECYETDALRAELRSRGATFRTRTDTEVVLQTYAHFGPAGLAKLNGMFAFAIWDRQARELFIARDRFGIKPLYYWHTPDRLVFASTLNALRHRSDFDGTVDPRSIELFLSTKFIPAPYTIFQEVCKLPPGHWARWKDGDLEIQRWWDVPLPEEGYQRVSAEEAQERVEELLQRAARARLVSERPVGLCLSGGIDSGLLAACLKDEGVKTFSLGFDERDYDESKVAAQVAQHLGLEHHVLICKMDAQRDFPAVVKHYDEPVGDSSAIALYNLSRLIREHVTVVLSGTGGDELFGGYMRYVGSRLAQLTQFVPGLGLLPRLLGRDESKSGWRGRLSRFARSASVGPLDCYQRFVTAIPAQWEARLRNAELVRANRGFSAADVFAGYFDRPRGCSLLTRLMYTDMKTVMADDYLVKEDRMTMAHSIEGRVPFLDHRLVEYAYSLPDAMKIRGLQTKRLLRRLARLRLPTAVSTAPKQGFEIPEAAWLRGPLAERTRDSLLSHDAAVNAFLEPSTVTRIVEDHLQGRGNHSRILWSLLTLETWLRNHAEQRRAKLETRGMTVA